MNDRIDETEALLGAARITTTPEVDERVLAAASRELPEPVFRLGPLATAAAVLLITGGLVWSVARFGGEAGSTAEDLIITQTLPMNTQEELPPGSDALARFFERDGGDDGLHYGGAGGGTGTDGHWYPYDGGRGGGGGGRSIKLRSSTGIVLEPGAEITIAGGTGGVYLGTYSYYAGGQGGGVGWIRLETPVAKDMIPGVSAADLPYEFRPMTPLGEEYDDLTSNPFRDPRHEPLSTFSADVDTASYANVRRILRSRQRPPSGAVRVEEMVNYFDYDYAEPEGESPFSVAVDAVVCPWNAERRIVRIGIRGKTIEPAEAPARNLVFLLDVSGSMESDDKLPLVKSAMALLVGQLDENDRVAIVTYAGNSGIALPPTPGNDRTTILGAINSLRSGGSTNAGSGIVLAYDLARKSYAKGGINRVILATDGDFNVGVTSRGGLEDLITEEREGGIFLTVLGVGTGNIKDSQMEMLADKGNGNYAYLDSILEAQKVLVREAAGTLMTIAKDVKLQVEFNPAQVGAYRLVGYENRMLAARDFADDTKDAGEIGAGHTVTALYEITPPGTFPGEEPLRYQKAPPALEPAEGFEEELLFVKVRYKEPDGTESKLLTFPLTDPGYVTVNDAPADVAFAAAVAAFGLKLKGSATLGDVSWALIEEIASGATGADPHGDRAEFVDLVRRASRLMR